MLCTYHNKSKQNLFTMRSNNNKKIYNIEQCGIDYCNIATLFITPGNMFFFLNRFYIWNSLINVPFGTLRLPRHFYTSKCIIRRTREFSYPIKAFHTIFFQWINCISTMNVKQVRTPTVIICNLYYTILIIV